MRKKITMLLLLAFYPYIYAYAFLFYYLMKPFYRRARMFSATQLKEDEEATVSLLTTDHGRHYGPTVVWTETDFLLFSYSSGVVSHEYPWVRSKYIH